MNQKTKYITGIVLSVLVICALTIPAFALTESDVQSQVSASGKEGVAGNLFVWFLCAVAFLKISQKIDSFMQGLGINVGHTGGSMLAEAMLAARSIAAARGVAGRGRGGNAGRGGSAGGSSGSGDSNTFLQGGLAGVANRSFYNGAYSDVGEYDAERNLTYSNKGTYGTAGFMEKAEMKGVLDLVSDIRKHSGVILGKLDNQVVCIPENSRLNGNIAVFGASGSMKTRAYCINRILQSASEARNGHKESLIITDPKSELYEKTSEYLRSKGYVVKVFNLIQPENSDSWNCLAEIEGDELMAQIFCDIIIRNTGSEKGDHFWNAAEMNLLKALVLYVALGYPPESRNIGEIYKLLVLNAEKELDNRFSMLPASHPARAPYQSLRGKETAGLQGLRPYPGMA